MSGAKLPSDIPESLNEAEAVLYRVGEFVETFSEMELMLVLVMGALTKMETSAIQFLWKDVFTNHKIKATRRAVIERLGSEDFRTKELRSVLNEIDRLVEFRNDLLHGSFRRVGAKMEHGKLGKNFQDLYDGLEELTPGAVYEKSSELYDLTLDLAAFISAMSMENK